MELHVLSMDVNATLQQSIDGLEDNCHLESSAYQYRNICFDSLRLFPEPNYWIGVDQMDTPYDQMFIRGPVLGFWTAPKRIMNATPPQSIDAQTFAENSSLAINDPIAVSSNLRMAMLRLKAKLFSEGSRVAYSLGRIAECEEMVNYRQIAFQLKDLDFKAVSSSWDVHRKTIFINIYNCLVIHALIDGLLEGSSFLSRLLNFMQQHRMTLPAFLSLSTISRTEYYAAIAKPLRLGRNILFKQTKPIAAMH